MLSRLTRLRSVGDVATECKALVVRWMRRVAVTRAAAFVLPRMLRLAKALAIAGVAWLTVALGYRQYCAASSRQTIGVVSAVVMSDDNGRAAARRGGAVAA